jgi:hypothetical protein
MPFSLDPDKADNVSLVFVLSTALGTDPLRPYQKEDLRRMLKACAADSFGIHSVTEDPGNADIILFVGAEHSDYRDVRQHPFLRKWREKCFLFDSGDKILPFMPGIYASIERRFFDPTRIRSGCYLRIFENDSVQPIGAVADARFLYTFVGSLANHPVRKQFSGLIHPRGYVRDTSQITEPLRRTGAPATAEFQCSYGELLSQSKFVLCPRGFGTSSWRLFEAMKAGRVPVIVSDDWVEPDGPEWDKFSLRIRESEVSSIPYMLENLESSAPEMGARAREEYENWFDESVFFHRTVETCLAILGSRRVPEKYARFKTIPQLLKPHFFRTFVLSSIKRGLLGSR